MEKKDSAEKAVREIRRKTRRRFSAMSAEGILFEPFAESAEPPLELALG